MTEEVVLQVAALPILYVVRYFTIRGVLNVHPVSRAGYNSVHPRHLGRCSRCHWVSYPFLIYGYMSPRITKLLVLRFLPPSCYVDSQNFKYSSRHLLLYSIHIFNCSACWCTSQTFGTFSKRHATSKLGKSSKNCLLSKSYLHHFKSFCITFPTFKAKSDADMLLLQVSHILCTPKLRME